MRELDRRRGPAGPALGAPARATVPAAEAEVAEAAPPSTARRVLAAGGAARDAAGALVVRRGRDGLRRPPGRRAARQLPFETWLLDRVAAARRRAARWWRSGSRPGPRHGVPGRGRRRRHRHRPLARRWSRRPGAASRTGTTEVGDLRRLMRPDVGARLGGGARVVLADPPGGLRAARRGRRAGPPARSRAGGWSSPCTPGPRCATSTSGSTHPVDLDFVLHEPAEVVAGVVAARAGRRRVVPPRPAHRPRRDHPASLRRGPQAGLTPTGADVPCEPMRVLFSSTYGYGHVIPMLSAGARLPRGRSTTSCGPPAAQATAAGRPRAGIEARRLGCARHRGGAHRVAAANRGSEMAGRPPARAVRVPADVRGER